MRANKTQLTLKNQQALKGPVIVCADKPNLASNYS